MVNGEVLTRPVREDGRVSVVQAGPEFKLLAVNDLADVCLATPAISNGTIVFRTLGLATAVTLTFAPRTGRLAPVYSTNGSVWRNVPQLVGDEIGPGARTGYTRGDDRGFVIQTTVPGWFARRRQTLPPANAVVDNVPKGAVLDAATGSQALAADRTDRPAAAERHTETSHAIVPRNRAPPGDARVRRL